MTSSSRCHNFSSFLPSWFLSSQKSWKTCHGRHSWPGERPAHHHPCPPHLHQHCADHRGHLQGRYSGTGTSAGLFLPILINGVAMSENRGNWRTSTSVAKGKFNNDTIKFKNIFRAEPPIDSGYHFGSRLLIKEKYLYICKEWTVKREVVLLNK